MNSPQKLLKEYMKQLNKNTDEEIIEIFNNEVGKGGWGTARASFLGALIRQFKIRRFDYSEIGDEKGYSFKRKVRLVGKKIKLILKSEPKVLSGGLFKVDSDDKEEKGYKLRPIDKRSTLF